MNGIFIFLLGFGCGIGAALLWEKLMGKKKRSKIQFKTFFSSVAGGIAMIAYCLSFYQNYVSGGTYQIPDILQATLAGMIGLTVADFFSKK